MWIFLKKALAYILDFLRRNLVPDKLFFRSSLPREESISAERPSALRRAYRFGRTVAFCLASYFFLMSISGVIIYRFIPPSITALMVMRTAEKISEGKKPVFRKQWVPLGKISPSMVLAVVSSEDNRFTEHFGFDLQAIQDAQEQARHRHRLRGASTISQQTAKNVFLWPSRSYIRKGLEAYYTILIEVFWSKKRIMEVYLNEIEMGDGIYGAEAAARYYFHKPAEKLTRSEAALIAAVLPNPIRWRPDKPSNYVLRRQDWILWNMNNIDKVDL